MMDVNQSIKQSISDSYIADTPREAELRSTTAGSVFDDKIPSAVQAVSGPLGMLVFMEKISKQ